MHKITSKKVLVSSIVLLLVGTTVLAGLLYFKTLDKKNKNENQRPETPVAPVQSEEEINKINSSLEGFNEIILASNNKEHSRVIELAKVYGQNSVNGKTERMNAYILCIDSARQTNDSANLIECETELDVIVQTLEPEDEASWQKLIEATKQGKAVDSASQDSQIQ